MEIEIKVNSEKQTMELGELIARFIPSGTTLLLDGDLGAGKTTLVRGIARGLHIKDVVQSPTFNIMKIYLKGDRPLIHIDAYRLADINNDIGLDEYIGYETGLTMIEWPLFIEKLLPQNTLWIEIKNTGDTNRHIDIYSQDSKLVEALK